MSTQADSTFQLASRLSQLERQHRHLRRVALGGLLLIPLGLAAFTTGRRAPVVQADRVELVTAGGATRAVLSADSAGVSLTFLDRKGRPASAIRLTNVDRFPSLTLFDSKGKAVAMLGGPDVKHLMQRERPWRRWAIPM
jgi:hypothetical protein